MNNEKEKQARRKELRRKRYLANQEQEVEYSRNYRKEHAEEIKIKKHEYYLRKKAEKEAKKNKENAKKLYKQNIDEYDNI